MCKREYTRVSKERKGSSTRVVVQLQVVQAQRSQGAVPRKKACAGESAGIGGGRGRYKYSKRGAGSWRARGMPPRCIRIAHRHRGALLPELGLEAGVYRTQARAHCRNVRARPRPLGASSLPTRACARESQTRLACRRLAPSCSPARRPNLASARHHTVVALACPP